MDLDWKDKYSIRVPEIDIQHQGFLNILRAYSSEQDSEKEKQLIEEMYRYAVYHFISEEELMQAYTYQEIEDHKLANQELLIELSSYVNPVEGFQFTKESLIFFLYKNFVDHADRYDRDFGEFLNAVRTV